MIGRIKGFSLIEMIVTLAITGFMMLALINIVTTMLQVSAITHNRSKIREDLANFTQYFERDIRNATRMGTCEGRLTSEISDIPGQTDFYCEIYTEDYYLWTVCPRENFNFCAGSNAERCEMNGQQNTICKFKMDIAGNPIGEAVYKFDSFYNVDSFEVTLIEQSKLERAEDSDRDEFSQNLVASTLVISHPNPTLEISNVVRQSLLTTKNYQGIIKKE